MQAYPPARTDLRVRDDTFDDLLRLRDLPFGIDQGLLQFGEQRRPMVTGAAEHYAVYPPGHVTAALLHSRKPAVQDHVQLRPLALEPMNVLVLERRNLAVLLGRQAAEDCDPRVDVERVDAGGRDRVDEGGEELIVVAIVDADAAFDGHRQ